MVTQKTTKGFQGLSENPSPNSISRQSSSLYNLTLDEIQTHLGNLEKPLGNMNLDELVKSVWTAEAIDHPSGFSISRDLSKKTVEEVWREIDAEERLGEMTLESFLNQAGVLVDSNNAEWSQYETTLAPRNQGHSQMPILMPNGDSGYYDMMGNLSDAQQCGRKRSASGEMVTVERRQKRMIKNRESAARSRARKQAYTEELEIKISGLEEEIDELKKTKEVEKLLPSAPPPEPKYQLRRTSSSPL